MMCLQRRRAGVEGLIEIENPNRVAQKSKKVTQIELDEPKQLSRRERCVFCVRTYQSVTFAIGAEWELYFENRVFIKKTF